MPCLFYGLECYTLPKSSLRSLDVVVGFLMKLFKTVNNEIIRECCSYFKLHKIALEFNPPLIQ